jgi:hypothetical protein
MCRILFFGYERSYDSYSGVVVDISLDQPRSDTSVSEVEISLRFRQFCWHMLSAVGGSEKVNYHTA